ncbi:class I SAM-dependent methyltransferase [Candidatus Saccharibacteria bacterium]|nr:class I SAM-dependent methyltransferase [Candidatus Saccharibacteria bacterium]
MSKENQKTLEVYEELFQEYFNGTKRRIKSRGIEKSAKKAIIEHNYWFEGFKTLGDHADILEIGSADGLGAKALAKHRFNVTTSNTVGGFIKVLEKSGLKPIKFNVLIDRLDCQFDGVLAWHVFVHFTPEDLKIALKNIHDILRPGGRLIFDVQTRGEENGEIAEWLDYEGDYHLGAKRFFQYYSESGVRNIIDDANFKTVKFERHNSDSGIGWLRFVVTPKS